MIVAKITRKYSIKGEMVQLTEGKEVSKDDFEKFSPEAKKKYFEIKTVKADKKSDKTENQ